MTELALTTARTRLALGLILVFLYVPVLIDHGFLAAKGPSVDLPSFYYAARAAFSDGVSPYTPSTWQSLQRQLGQPVFPFLYPPSSLLFFLPYSWFSYDFVKAAVLVVNHLSLLALLYLLLLRILHVGMPADRPGPARPGAPLAGWPLLPLLILYMLQFHPVAVTLDHGQINLTVLLLLSLFWIALRERRREALTALPLAGAILLKNYPAIFLPLLVLRRRWRAAAWATAYVAAVMGLSWFVVPRQAWRDWVRLVLPTGGYGQDPLGLLPPAMPWNQSVNGFAARLFLNPTEAPAAQTPWAAKALPLAAAAVVLGVLVWLAVRLTRRRETRYLNDEFATALLAMFLVAPLSWEHHLVFVLPAALLALIHLLTGNPSTRSALGLGLVLFVLAWPMEFLFRLPTSGLVGLLVSLKGYAVAALWVYFVRRLWKVSEGLPVVGAEELPTAAPARPPRRSS